jgi:hypothetical protein
MKLNRRQFKYMLLYLVSVSLISIIIHEASHALAALLLGVPFTELGLRFYGINPSVTIPAWFIGTPRLVVYYAGGLVSGLIMLFTYLFYWMRRYNRQASVLRWSLGLFTIEVAVIQLAISYFEGGYHAAYIIDSGSVFSPTHILICGFMIAAFFLHRVLNPSSKMRETITNKK